MAHTHDLIKAKISMKAGKEMKRREKNDEMVRFGKFPLFFFSFQFSQIIS